MQEIPFAPLTAEQAQMLHKIANQIPTAYGKDIVLLIENAAIEQARNNEKSPSLEQAEEVK